jgi:succinate dehydrogenase/fumarate reductase flavoprotein subunit
MNKLELETDVLIIGGGMAACWAAIGAARQGAEVILVDKGFVGTSGVTATAGPGHWWVPPDPKLRAAAIEKRHQSAFGLAEKPWAERVLETTWRSLPQLAAYYPFSRDGSGNTYYAGVRGPEYLRALRCCALDLGVRILDHHPALELLTHADGAVAGAAGYARLERRASLRRALAYRKMAGHRAVFRNSRQLRLLFAASGNGEGAAWMEPAAGRATAGGCDLTGDRPEFAAARWIGLRDRRDQGLRIGMRGVTKNLLRGPDFHQAAKIHHADAIG